ncbi:hypothetical protein MMC25_005775 [Agyrium rufum]|nr:hypothetical protein [Agyrium rufum]
MKALILDAERKTADVKNVPKPIPAPTELLIRVQAVALNPIDSLYVYTPLGSTGRTMGSDFAGVVEAIGDAVPISASTLKAGDRVAGFLQGACSVNERPGAFAEYLCSPWDLVWKVKDSMKPQEAAAISLCGLTAAQALFYRMGLQAPFSWQGEFPADTSQKEPRLAPEKMLQFFIYGASTSVGMYAAQLVRRFAEHTGREFRLLGAASPKHFGMLKSEPYCYTELVNYRDSDWPSHIKSLTGGVGIDYAYDCISEGSTVSNTAGTLAAGGKIAVVRSREGQAWTAEYLPTEPSYGAVWEGLGEDVQYQGMSLPASPEARAFAVGLYKWLSEGGRLEPNPLREMPGGLERVVEDGLRLLGSGTMGDRALQGDKEWMKPLSAEKMVYTITPF